MAPKLKLHTIFGCFYEDGMKIKMASDILPNLNICFVFRRDKKPVKTVYHYFYNLNCLVKREIGFFVDCKQMRMYSGFFLSCFKLI